MAVLPAVEWLGLGTVMAGRAVPGGVPGAAAAAGSSGGRSDSSTPPAEHIEKEREDRLEALCARQEGPWWASGWRSGCLGMQGGLGNRPSGQALGRGWLSLAVGGSTWGPHFAIGVVGFVWCLGKQKARGRQDSEGLLGCPPPQWSETGHIWKPWRGPRRPRCQGGRGRHPEGAATASRNRKGPGGPISQ